MTDEELERILSSAAGMALAHPYGRAYLAAAEKLVAEVRRLTAERDGLRARVAELEAAPREGKT